MKREITSEEWSSMRGAEKLDLTRAGRAPVQNTPINPSPNPEEIAVTSNVVSTVGGFHRNTSKTGEGI